MDKAICVTEWTTRGAGDTVREIAALLGKQIDDTRKTNLRVVRFGEVTSLDEDRAREVLSRMRVKI